MGFIVDDLLRPTGATRARMPIVSVDGGQETFRRIRDPNSLFAATVAIPFERMGGMAVQIMERVAVRREPRERITRTPILFVPAVLVDATNVPADGQWPW
jgi:simple sugar transport system substrate-binding protein/ribose transport system substrate-binding protein